MKTMLRILVIAGCVLTTSIAVDELFDTGFVVADAEARIGRPMTPISVAGVARRTTRRVIRRSTIYAATLPRGCSTVVIEGMALHQCGRNYYQPYKNQYVIVYVD
ncbi:MAG: hypothetical protein QNK27_11115 [Desulfuromusa sp.]|nr:hypothetical protein [Desulfuromusa sp.]